ncbi:hypothetical protein [Spiroplasma ixodetis]|uniref:Uncharacterized protein n=1 Tax=Spiroplasma ixodetis TaxID=2141 RepID=A0ABM8BZB4_9MOLU|nr:hypothetical protein [Spiroplasma ixodetis]BDT05210.1 hypothetical protein SHM_28560 [Spiroplasma ixodetis]
MQTSKITKEVATQTNTTEENKYFERIVKVEIHSSDFQIENQPSTSAGIYHL